MPRTRLNPPRSQSHQPDGEPDRIRGRLQLEKNGSPFLAPARVDLLEAIGGLGSITSAAKAVGLSYKAAWDAVDAMNNQAGAALVSRSVGGAKGGGTQLTEYGKRVVELVRKIERDYADVLTMLEDPSSELAEYNRLRRQLSLRTSARNQWIGKVTRLNLGTVRAEVSLALGSDLVRASVSVSSVSRLAIEPGAELCALVKATSIGLTLAGAGEPRDVDTGNHLEALVAEVTRGHDEVEITALLPGERSITAVLPVDAQTEQMVKGTAVVASFAPEQVVLVQLQSS
ncbi:MAG: TOBE domain-containing protein [Polyangiales bacterium]